VSRLGITIATGLSKSSVDKYISKNKNKKGIVNESQNI
jgi:hypothetical protein